MKINSSFLFLRNLYYYDISSCHYNVLKSFGVDVSKLDQNDKESRNIQIGLMMRDNPRITEVLRETTTNLISEYLNRNNISEDDIILRQYDGFLSTKRLKILDSYIVLDLRSVFDIFISSFDKSKYLALDIQGNTVIKGISNRNEEIDKIYMKILKLNFLNKFAIFKGMQDIKDEILSSDNVDLYCIPFSDDYNGMYFKEHGLISIAKSAKNMIDLDDIDRFRYFDFYIRPFTESLVLVFA